MCSGSNLNWLTLLFFVKCLIWILIGSPNSWDVHIDVIIIVDLSLGVFFSLFFLLVHYLSSHYAATSQLLASQLEPLTEQQVMGICNLQQSSQQAEDALSQGMEALQQSLAETLAGSLGPSGSSGNVANYMGQMAMAMGKLGTLESFLRQVNY